MTIKDHPLIVKNLLWQDEVQTCAFARSLADRLLGLSPAAGALIELRGDIGAGKTSLVRHLLGALGVKGRIKSPTYAVVETYTLEGVTPLSIWHFDFYRFNDPDEWEEAGFREMFASTGLKLVEWPEKAGGHLPAPDLALHIDVLPDQSRRVILKACTPAGRALIE